MTTSSWATVIDNTNDAGFRTWGSELSSKLAAAGLVQTSDTGQINWATVTRPGVANTAAGYEIWRFADSSLYLKLEYGTGAATNCPNMWLTVGTGSNGSGTLAGQTNTRASIGHTATDSGGGSTTTARSSYLCVTADYVGLCWKAQANVNGLAYAMFTVEKYVDASGAAISDGFIAHTGPTSGGAGQVIQAQSVRTAATAKAWTAGTAYMLIPTGMTDSVVGSDNQVFLHQFPTPRVIVGLCVFSVFESEAVLATTFAATPVGSTSHTYLSLGTQAGLANQSGVCAAMLWE